MTTSKNSEFNNGLKKQEAMSKLIAGIQIAKELLATLELGQPILWTGKLQRIQPEHLRILLLEVMEEIYTMETILDQLLTSTPTCHA